MNSQQRRKQYRAKVRVAKANDDMFDVIFAQEDRRKSILNNKANKDAIAQALVDLVNQGPIDPNLRLPQ